MMRVGTCKGCGADIIWARTGSGAKMPLDAQASADGCFVLEGDRQDPVTYRLANDAATTYTGDKYTSHFQTCRASDQFRGKK